MKLKCDITINYPDFTLDARFSVGSGKLLTLLGPSGCGKTTLHRAIAGLEPLTSGTLVLGDRDITGIPPERRNLGFVFQDYALFSHLNVFENVAYGPKTKNWTKKEIRETVRAKLQLVGLSGYEQRKVNELSGGEQQRVALARALAVDPTILLLDEPLSALDAGTRIELRRKISQIQRELAITAIYVTHDQEEALAISDSIALIDDGKVLQFGPPETLYYYPKNEFTARFIGTANIIAKKYFFRPEHCSLAPISGTDAYHFHGPLTRREYLGKEYLGEMFCASRQMTIAFYIPLTSSLAPGDTVDIYVDKNDVRELPD